jgi:hypothetical protein
MRLPTTLNSVFASNPGLTNAQFPNLLPDIRKRITSCSHMCFYRVSPGRRARVKLAGGALTRGLDRAKPGAANHQCDDEVLPAPRSYVITSILSGPNQGIRCPLRCADAMLLQASDERKKHRARRKTSMQGSKALDSPRLPTSTESLRGGVFRAALYAECRKVDQTAFLRCFKTTTAMSNNTEQTRNATTSTILSIILLRMHPRCHCSVP